MPVAHFGQDLKCSNVVPYPFLRPCHWIARSYVIGLSHSCWFDATVRLNGAQTTLGDNCVETVETRDPPCCSSEITKVRLQSGRIVMPADGVELDTFVPLEGRIRASVAVFRNGDR